MKPYFISIIVVCLAVFSTGVRGEQSSETMKAVLVTGASSGIGKEIAYKLADQGYYVYAGARTREDIRTLSVHPNMRGIRLDVTKQIEINAAVRQIKRAGRGLYGLVNNAGVFLFDPMIEVTESDMQFIMDVNVMGPYRVTRAFAPLIIESQGRITTTGSIAGTTTGRFMGPYSMSKFAVEAFTDALHAEMAKFDVEVSVIEPGNFRSDIMKNMQKRYKRTKKNRKDTRFAEEIESFSVFTKEDRSNHQVPVPVADAVLAFMSDDYPKRRYMVTPNQGEARFTIEAAMSRLVEQNHDQQFSFSQSELEQILDDSLKQINQ